MNGHHYTVEPGQPDPPMPPIPSVTLPGKDIFARRAERLYFLAQGHQLGAFLHFLGALAEAQQRALDSFPPLPERATPELALCRRHGLPPLAAGTWRREPAWRSALSTILQLMTATELPPAAGAEVAALLHVGEAALEAMADRILAGDVAGVEPGRLPFVAAALQVYWVRMTMELEQGACNRLEEPGACPVCGSAAMAGIVRSAGSEQGLRYLCCPLCSTQWHLVRLTCSTCNANHGIEYLSLDGTNGAVKAECCSSCGHYLKLLYQEKLGSLEAMADDVATLALDMLMTEENRLRIGPNLLFHPGSAL